MSKTLFPYGLKKGEASTSFPYVAKQEVSKNKLMYPYRNTKDSNIDYNEFPYSILDVEEGIQLVDFPINEKFVSFVPYNLDYVTFKDFYFEVDVDSIIAEFSENAFDRYWFAINTSLNSNNNIYLSNYENNKWVWYSTYPPYSIESADINDYNMDMKYGRLYNTVQGGLVFLPFSTDIYYTTGSKNYFGMYDVETDWNVFEVTTPLVIEGEIRKLSNTDDIVRRTAENEITFYLTKDVVSTSFTLNDINYDAYLTDEWNVYEIIGTKIELTETLVDDVVIDIADGIAEQEDEGTSVFITAYSSDFNYVVGTTEYNAVWTTEWTINEVI